MNYRPERVSNLIQKELGKFILREAEFEPGVLATITYVDVDGKLNRAKVGISVIPSEKADAVLKILGNEAGKLQWFLLKKINIKPMPRIIFELDRGPERAAEVERALLEEKS
jgi:ribosome-binding factor A